MDVTMMTVKKIAMNCCLFITYVLFPAVLELLTFYPAVQRLEVIRYR